jgi:plastocyanin
MRRSLYATVALGVTVIGGSTVACFPERSTSAGPSPDACDTSLPPELLGATVVAIRNFTFEPAEVRVPMGGKVAWVNCAPADEPAHTSTSDQAVWNSPLLPPGATFGFTFTQAGTFPYHCEPHPFMQATVIVEP